MHDTRDDVLVDLRWPQSAGTIRAGAVCAQYKLTPSGESDSSGNPAAACLIFDGANRGIYTGNAVVNMAREYGWFEAPPSIDTACGDLYDDTDVDSAEDYLNELTPDGYQFGFSDGDFFLANDVWWEIASE